ncbi:MAG: nucleoside deaminase [Magnetococcales bacterium]|nr:nucleoside deaminase [Magnetococcales bacterium]
MLLALLAAADSGQRDEIPVGAIVCEPLGWVLAETGNDSAASHDPLGHAEIRALRQAAQRRGNYRLPGSSLFVTLEPCVMCQAAIELTRVERVVFAAHRHEEETTPSTAYATASLQMIRRFFAPKRELARPLPL